MFKLIIQFIRFGIIGFSVAAIYFILLEILYRFYNLPLTPVVVSSYMIAVSLHFYLNRIFTFNTKNVVGHQLIRYLIVAIINLAVFTITTKILGQVINNSIELISLVGILSASIISFILSKFWVFR